MKNIETRKVAQFKGHDAGIYAICIGQKPETFFTAGGDKVVAEWNTKSGKGETFSIKLNQTIYSLSHLTLINLLIIGTANGGIHWVDLTGVERQPDPDFSVCWTCIHACGGLGFYGGCPDRGGRWSALCGKRKGR